MGTKVSVLRALRDEMARAIAEAERPKGGQQVGCFNNDFWPAPPSRIAALRRWVAEIDDVLRRERTMHRAGDPTTWENELHQALHAHETEIMRLMKSAGPRKGLTSHDIIALGYSKSHASLWRWLMKLHSRGLVEREHVHFYTTEYGLWMTRNDR